MKTLYISHLVTKGLCLFGILIPCFVLTANGQEKYEPLLKDGRVWNCIEVSLGEEKNDTVTREYRIKGTSEIEGRICYNLFLGSRLIDHCYEEGPKVFHHTASGWELLFDFSLSSGDVVLNFGGMIVDTVKDLVMKGVSRRCLYFPLATDDTQLCWIEGIGSTLSGPFYNYWDIESSTFSEKLLSVYDGDVCIFEADDFMTTEMKDVNYNHFKRSFSLSFYDLSGRRLAAPPAKGIYIRDGKKVVKPLP